MVMTVQMKKNSNLTSKNQTFEDERHFLWLSRFFLTNEIWYLNSYQINLQEILDITYDVRKIWQMSLVSDIRSLVDIYLGNIELYIIYRCLPLWIYFCLSIETRPQIFFHRENVSISYNLSISFFMCLRFSSTFMYFC